MSNEQRPPGPPGAPPAGPPAQHSTLPGGRPGAPAVAPSPHAPQPPSPYAPPQQPSPYAPPQQPSPYAAPPHAQPPYAAQQPRPQAASPYAPPAAHAMHGQPSPFAHAPHAPPPHAPPPHAPPPAGWAPQGVAPPADSAPSAVLQQAFMRAFRLRIEPDEVTASERAALHAANVTDPLFMAFLAWRRAVLVLVAIALVPLTILRFADAFGSNWPSQLRFIPVIPAIAEAFLCVMCWLQLANWTRWAKQRRALFRSWLVFMAAPFVVYLIPVDSVLADALGDLDPAVASAELVTLKIAIAVQALLVLAPKAVSLLAGTVRAGIVTKMLFAGAAGPGWLVALAAPLYTLFVFTLLIVPYQVTGSGWYFGAMASLLAAQIALGRAGFALARPMTHEDAVKLVARARLAYLGAMIGFGVCLLAALGGLASKIGVITILTTVLSFEANVLVLTLIGTDFLITNLDRARGLSSGTAHLADESNKKLAAFVAEP